MVESDYIKGQLARIAWIDGGQEGLNGALAVAFTIRNRVRAGWWNGDWLEVLAHHEDYRANDVVYGLTLPNPRKNPIFFEFLQDMDAIYSGLKLDTVTVAQDSIHNFMKFGGEVNQNPVALWYGRLNDPKISQDFVENISRSLNHKRIAQVGNITFFS